MKYKTLVNELVKRIDDNIEKGINRMPSEQEIGKTYQVSRQTVRQALSLLKEEGLIESRRGSGSYITGRKSFAGGNKIAVLLSNRTDYIYPKLIQDIRLALLEAGYEEEIRVTENRTQKERKILQEYIASPPRGMIVEGCKSAFPNPNTDLYLQLRKKGVVMIFLFNHYKELPDIPCIKGDNAGGSRLLTRHLIDLGYQRIGGIFKYDDLQGPERFSGYSKTITEYGLDLPDDFTAWIDSSHMEAFRRGLVPIPINSFLKTVTKELDALICYNDEIAYRLMQRFADYEIKVPENLAIAAFDNSYFSSAGSIPITTLSHENQKMGALAAAAVIRLAKGLPVSSVEVPWELSVRESTKGRIKNENFS